MKKIQIYTMTALLSFALASCTKDGGINPPGPSESNVAYISIAVEQQSQTRSSDEADPVDYESDIKSLYLITFDGAGRVLGIPGGNSYYISVTPSGTYSFQSPEAVKISASAENLIVIANPGPKLMGRISALTNGSDYATFNAAISQATVNDIKGVESVGFAMISGGSTVGKSPTSPDQDGNMVLTPYVDIKGKMVVVETTEEAAKLLAEETEKRVAVRIERLASKLFLKEKAGGAVPPTGATFTFLNWTIDVVNETYFPFAKKTLRANHAPTPVNPAYLYNFYTEDPNYADLATTEEPPVILNHTGLAKGTVAPSAANSWSYEPILPWNALYGWLNKDTYNYVTENTMEATAQRFGNATRLVFKAKYTPAGFTADADWFQWAGYNYQTIEALQAEYDEVATAEPGESPLKDACDKFYNSIKRYLVTEKGGTLAANNFSELTTAQLAEVPNGGEVVKDGKNAVIRWFQSSLNYYYYEVRHDNDADAANAFAKYGVVRNNWYNLTLNTVSGPGTPWYPDVDNPGPGDPDPKDPIDTATGYLGITVTPEPWIVWETGFGI